MIEIEIIMMILQMIWSYIMIYEIEIFEKVTELIEVAIGRSYSSQNRQKLGNTGLERQISIKDVGKRILIWGGKLKLNFCLMNHVI